MAMEIPMDVIKAVQIALRKEANMSSYNPVDTPLPNLPSVEETIAELDPSPPYLRCKHCKGRLQRGVQSLICVFCGIEPCKDIPPDPINFRGTFGYRWLLQSLNLNGSEIVDLPTGANEFNRGQTARKDKLSLSDLLNIEIKWTARPEKVAVSLSSETPPQPKNIPDLSGVNIDNFFSEEMKGAAANTSQELFESSTETASNEINAVQVRETLSLFENVRPAEMVVESTEGGKSGDSFSGWAANFQSASSETLTQPSENLPQASENIPQPAKSHDPFVSSTVYLSPHMDTVFGSGVDSHEKSNRSMSGSASMRTDLFQDDLLVVSNSGLAGGSDPFTMLAEVKGEVAENANNSFPSGFDWAEDNQLQTTSIMAPENKVSDENDDSFDAWDDFTGSNSAANLVDSSLKESVNGTSSVNQTSDNKNVDENDHSFDAWNDFTGSNSAANLVDHSLTPIVNATAPVDQTSENKNTDENDDSFDAWNDFTGSNSTANLVDSSLTQSVNGTAPFGQTSEIDLFGPSSNSRDLEFDIFSQPDFSAGMHGSITQPEPSVLDRLADASTKSGDVAEGGDVSSVRSGSKSEEGERIMAQMHDLSFMLESTLSIPPKRDGLPSQSQD